MMPRSRIDSVSSSSSASVKCAARIARIGREVFDRRAARLALRYRRGRFLADIADQRCEAASQSRMIRHRRRS